MKPLLVISIAYLLGSIPFGYLIVRATQGTDIRKTGSGGTGATNVSRRAGKVAGVLTLILDALKGAAAVLLATMMAASLGQNAWWCVATASMAVMLGHIFPVWLRFRGGKGVATGFGVFLVLDPYAVAFAAMIFVLVVLSTRYVSLGSMLAAISIPLFLLIRNALIRPIPEFAPLMAAAFGGALLIAFAHRGNIARLIQGKESKFR